MPKKKASYINEGIISELTNAFALATAKRKIGVVMGDLVWDRLVQGEAPGVELLGLLPQPWRPVINMMFTEKPSHNGQGEHDFDLEHWNSQ